MPQLFKSPCQFPNCKEYAQTGKRYCARHAEERRKAYSANHTGGTRTERGYSNKWLKASKSFLMEHPLCAECERQGRVTPATEVDHIIPHKGDMELFWDVSNWQALCHKCHARKTALYDGGFGRPCTPRGSIKNRRET